MKPTRRALDLFSDAPIEEVFAEVTEVVVRRRTREEEVAFLLRLRDASLKVAQAERRHGCTEAARLLTADAERWDAAARRAARPTD